MTPPPKQVKRGLGKGLEALLSPKKTAIAPQRNETNGAESANSGRQVQSIPLDRIDPMPNQPRTRFRKSELQELSISIAEKGVLQPIIVRSKNDRFELVVGERRFHASQMAGLNVIPALVMVVDDEEAFEIALIENVQRENLNPIEIAKALKRLIENKKLSQEEVADKIGKNRATVANYLRLLNLHGNIQDKIESGDLSFGHGRALVSMPKEGWDRLDFGKLVGGGYSVRELETISSKAKKSQGRKKRVRDPIRTYETPQVRMLRQKIEKQLMGMRVELIDHDGKGKLTIHYRTLDEFDFLMEKMGFDLR